MPGYIGYTPQFKPISLQEYLQVPSMIINEYKEAEKEFNEYQDKVAAVEALAGNNKKAMDIINQYKTYLGDATNSISTSGIKNKDSYSAAKKARSYYRDSVMKLEPAITAFQAAQKARAAKDDGTLIGPELSLDAYIDNPLYEDRFVHGSAIQKEAMQAAAAASARRKKDPVRSDNKDLKGLYGIKTEAGYSPQELELWLSGKLDLPELTDIANQIASKYGEYDINKVGQYITRGIVDGIAYDNKTDFKNDPIFNANLELSTWKQKKMIELGLAGTKAGQTDESVTRLPSRLNKIEGASTKAGRYQEYYDLVKYFENHPSLKNMKDPTEEFNKKYKSSKGSTLEKTLQYAKSGDREKYAKEKAKYDKLVRYRELEKEVRADHPEWFDKMTGTLLETDLLANVAERTTGYTFDLTPKAKEQLLNSINTYTNTAKEGDNLFIKDEEGDAVPNSSIRDLDPKDVEFADEDGVMWMFANGKAYILEPGTFGEFDAAVRPDINALYSSGQFDTYNKRIQAHMKDIVNDARSKAVGQSETSSKLGFEYE